MSSRSINKVILVGNLTRDPELKYTPSGTAVATLGVATNRNWTTQTGEIKEDVQFHRIVAWQKLAELASKLLAKGRKVYVEGRIVYRTYTGKDGQQKSITEIIMDDFVVLDSRRLAESAPADQTETDTTEAHEELTETIPNQSTKLEEKKTKNDTPENINPDDIDIPF